MMGEIVKQFESKKNRVYLVNMEGTMQVLKVQESEESAFIDADV